MKQFARAGVIALFIGLLVALRVLNHRSTTGATAPARALLREHGADSASAV